MKRQINKNLNKTSYSPNISGAGVERRFKCEKCQSEWEEPFGTGKKGIEMSCPKCQSRLVHRVDFHGHGFGKQFWGYKNKKSNS